jgi:hypothetical protein
MILDVGIHHDIPAKVYRADPCPAPSLNASLAKVLCTRSPKHAWLEHPRLGGLVPASDEDIEVVDKKATKEKTLGLIHHRLLLGAGPEIAIVEAKDWRGSDAKAAKAAALAEGKIPALRAVYEEAVVGSDDARSQLDSMGLQRVFRTGFKEVTLIWKEGPNYHRAMLDNLIIDEDAKTAEVWDLKTVSRSSHPEACAAQILNLGYDFSRVFYKQGLGALRPDLSGRIKFNWAFMEVKPPFAVTPVDISGEWEMAALQHYCNATEAWRKCLAADKWPTYTTQIVRLEPKPWMLAAAMGAEIAGNL